MSRMVRTVKHGAAIVFAAMATFVLLPSSYAQTDQPSRIQDMQSKLLDAGTPAGPVPDDEEVQVTLVLKHASSTAADAAQGAHIEQLTASQFAQRFSANPGTLAKITAFAQANHLRVVESDPIKRRDILAGSASAVANAFTTQLHRFSMSNGQTYRSASTPPSLPSELAPDIEAVVGLNTRPLFSPRFLKNNATPAETHAFEVTQITSLYNFPADVDGKGQTIAIMQFGGGFDQADIDAYFSSVKLPTPNITTVSVNNTANSPNTDANSDGEVALDIEVAGAAANGANLVVYFAPNNEQGMVNALLDAVHNQLQPSSVITFSWGAAEDQWDQQGLTALNSALQDAATLGVTVIAAAGDNGSSDGLNDKKLHVDHPASNPYVLAVGGTSLVTQGKAASEAVWNDGKGHATGGGVSLIFARPAYQVPAKVPPHPATGFQGRGVPDVAGDADPQTGYRIHVHGADVAVGGTSAAAPLWAALVARLNQKLGRRLGFMNDKLYAMAASFHGVASGSNDVEGLGAYAAAAGWNPCAGLGSPDAAQILSRLAASTPTTTPPPPATNYYQSLLTQGYDVKDVFLVSASDSTRLSGAVQQQDTVLVTLQKGGATATCWVEFSTWHQQSLGGTSVTCNLLH